MIVNHFIEIELVGAAELRVLCVLRLPRMSDVPLIEDAASIAKGVEVLIGVSDDLGCLFYHLLENPTLCDIEHQ
jgi:hypothetical protein